MAVQRIVKMTGFLIRVEGYHEDGRKMVLAYSMKNTDPAGFGRIFSKYVLRYADIAGFENQVETLEVQTSLGSWINFSGLPRRHDSRRGSQARALSFHREIT